MKVQLFLISLFVSISTTIDISAQSLSITDIQPKNGAPGNTITLWGFGFASGFSTNKVKFIPVNGGAAINASNTGLGSNAFNLNKLSARIPYGLEGGNYRIVLENETNGASDTLATLFSVTTGGGYFGELGSNKQEIADLKSVLARDINGDGHIDLIGGDNDRLSWYRNNGSSNPTFSRNALPYPYLSGPASFHVSDLDGDGDLDVIGSFYSATNYLIWYENDGALSPTFTQHTLDDHDFDRITKIDARDMDSDGDVDIVAISDYELLLFTNDGAATPTFSKSVIKDISGTTERFESLFIFDDDSGFRMNIITGHSAGTIAIHKNLGSGSFDIDETIVTTNAGIVSDLTVADVGYGSHLDIVSSSSSYSTSKISWYNSAGSHAEITLNSSVNRPESIFAGDFDGDGDYDIISNSRLNGNIFLYESNGASTSYFTERTISTSENGAYNMTAADLDNDGDIDILTTYGGKTYWYKNMEAPIESKSVVFDGDGDYISIADDDALDLTNSFTVEAWIKPTSLDAGFQRFLSKSGAYGIGVSNSAIRFTTYGVKDYDLSYTLTIEEWVHIATVMDASNTITFFVNGENIGALGTSLGSANSSTDPLSIGSNSTGGEAFNGKIDEVRIWNDERTQQQIQTHMYQSLVGDEANLLAYYSFDGSGSTAVDFTANTFDGTITGDVTRNNDTHPYGAIITGSEGWRMLSAPVSGVSYGSLLDTLWTQGFSGSDHTGGNSNVLIWDETTHSFNSISNATDIPSSGQGFITFVYNDDNFDGVDDGFPKHILTDITQQAGEISPSLTFTDSGTLADDGWNLVGNPYGATIDWDAASGLSSSNLDASFYVWSDSANAGAGDYLSWNGTTGTFGGGKIAPWQGFWVKANAAAPSLSLTDDARSSGGVFRKQAPISELRFNLSGETLSSRTILMFSEQALIEKDELDAYKLSSLNKEHLSLFTQLENGSALDINALPKQLEKSLNVPLDIRGSDLNGKFELTWNSSSLPEAWNLTLIDSHTGKEVNLRDTQQYHFDLETASKTVHSESEENQQSLNIPVHGVVSPTIIKAKANSSSRFTLRIVPSGVSVSNDPATELPTVVELDQNYPNPFNPSTSIAFGLPQSGKVTLEVFDLLGRKVATLLNDENKSAGRYTVNFDANGLSSGMYIYRLQTGSSIITKKLTLIK